MNKKIKNLKKTLHNFYSRIRLIFSRTVISYVEFEKKNMKNVRHNHKNYYIKHESKLIVRVLNKNKRIFKYYYPIIIVIPFRKKYTKHRFLRMRLFAQFANRKSSQTIRWMSARYVYACVSVMFCALDKGISGFEDDVMWLERVIERAASTNDSSYNILHISDNIQYLRLWMFVTKSMNQISSTLFIRIISNLSIWHLY